MAKNVLRSIYITEADYCKEWWRKARRLYGSVSFQTLTQEKLEQTVLVDILKGRIYGINTDTDYGAGYLLERLFYYHPMYKPYHETHTSYWSDGLLMIQYPRKNAIITPLGLATVEIPANAT